MKWLKDSLTPKNTEEVRPGIFLQQKTPTKYKVLNPLVWNGKWRLRKQFSIRSFIWLIIIGYLAWSYQRDIGVCRDITMQVLNNPQQFCKIVLTNATEAARSITNYSNLSLLWK